MGILLSRVFFLLLITAVPATAAQAADEKTGDDSPVIGVLLKSTNYLFWKAIEEDLYETAEAEGLDIFVMSNTRINDGQEQLNLCETMLLKSPDAMIVGAVNLTNLQSCLRKAQSRGIPVIDMDGNITEESAAKYNLDVAFSVAADNKLLGRMAAGYLEGRTGKVLILEGLPGSLPSIQRVEGFLEHLPDGLDVVASLPTDWNRMKAADITNDILVKHPDLDIIFAVADAMALGAYEAARQKGKAEDITFIGVDGNREAQQAILDGRIHAAIAQLPSLMAQESLLKTRRYLEGESFAFDQYLPAITLTKDVLEAGEDPLLKHTFHAAVPESAAP